MKTMKHVLASIIVNSLGRSKNPLDAMGICLNKQKLMYKVLAPSSNPHIKFLWTYEGSEHMYVSVAG